MIKVLLISRKAERCGVADYGKRVYNIISKSKQLEPFFAEISSSEDYDRYFDLYKPDVVLYNYYPVILPFITDEFLANKRHVPHIAIYHEVGLAFTPTAIIDIDSTRDDIPENNYWTSPRPLFENIELIEKINNIPTIGSCGFGFPDKNFPNIAKLVTEQFDEALIRLNIPFATFGDDNGDRAREEIRKIEKIISDSGKEIKLEVTHDFLEHEELINFLRGNDINLFLYDPHTTRSLSGSIDYALSCRRPIGLSRSWMFRHINWVKPSIFVDEISIKDIIKNGIDALQPIYEKHTNQKFLEKYELVIKNVLKIN